MAEITPIELANVAIEPDNLDAEKAPVIFLHGLSASKEYWMDIPEVTANKTGRKVYVIEARNHGDTEWSDVFTFESNVVDLLHFMDARDIGKAVLVGHSMGGVTVMKTALKHPDRVESVVVEDMSPKALPSLIVEGVQVCAAAAKEIHFPPGMTEKEAAKHLRDFMHKDLAPEMKAVAEESAEDIPMPLRRTSDGGFALKANVNVIFDILDELKTDIPDPGPYEGPACFIYGTKSPFPVSADESFIKERFPAAELVEIEDATHTVHNDKTEEFVKSLLSFLTKQE